MLAYLTTPTLSLGSYSFSWCRVRVLSCMSCSRRLLLAVDPLHLVQRLLHTLQDRAISTHLFLASHLCVCVSECVCE